MTYTAVSNGSGWALYPIYPVQKPKNNKKKEHDKKPTGKATTPIRGSNHSSSVNNGCNRSNNFIVNITV